MLLGCLRAWHKHHIARSAIFGRRVLLYSFGCACVSFVIYLFCRRPDAKLNDVGENGEMYFRCVHPAQPPTFVPTRKRSSPDSQRARDVLVLFIRLHHEHEHGAVLGGTG